MKLELIACQLNVKFGTLYDRIFVEDSMIICEESYDNYDDENDNNCYEAARRNGILLTNAFPMLEIANYYCHRHKYAIVELKLKEETKTVEQ